MVADAGRPMTDKGVAYLCFGILVFMLLVMVVKSSL